MTTINEVIREATSEHEVYFLLTSYVEAVRQGDMLSCLPGEVRELPVQGVDDVRARIDGLKTELRQSLPRNTRSRVIVEQTTDLFSEALNRLLWLEWERRRVAAMAA